MGWDGRVGRCARKDLAPPSLIESSSPRWAGVVKYGAEPEHDMAPPSLHRLCRWSAVRATSNLHVIYLLGWEDQVSRSSAASNTCFIMNNSSSLDSVCAAQVASLR